METLKQGLQVTNKDYFTTCSSVSIANFEHVIAVAVVLGPLSLKSILIKNIFQNIQSILTILEEHLVTYLHFNLASTYWYWNLILLQELLLVNLWIISKFRF